MERKTNKQQEFQLTQDFKKGVYAPLHVYIVDTKLFNIH